MANKKQGLVNLKEFDQPLQQPTNAATQQQSVTETPQPSNTVTYPRIDAATLKEKKPIPRTNGCTYYLSDEQIAFLARVKCFNGVDKQDIIRTALQEFIDKYHTDDSICINAGGVEAVAKHITIKNTTK